MSHDDGPSPYHLVNRSIGRHHGPFSTYTDALLARYIARDGWRTAEILDNAQFAAHLDRSLHHHQEEETTP